MMFVEYHTPDGNALHQKLMEVCRLNLTDSETTRIGSNFSEAAITKLKKVEVMDLQGCGGTEQTEDYRRKPDPNAPCRAL
jgi:hypothetical protein